MQTPSQCKDDKFIMIMTLDMVSLCGVSEILKPKMFLLWDLIFDIEHYLGKEGNK